MPDIGSAYTIGAVMSSVFWALICIALYVMLAFGLMAMGRKTGHPYPWLAWIPVANLFLLAALAGAARKKVVFPFLLLALMCVGAAVFSALFRAMAHFTYGTDGFSIFLAVIAWMTGIAAYVLYCVLANGIFRRFKPEYSTVFTVLSVIFWFLGPIFILADSFGTPDQVPFPQQGAQAAGIPPQSAPEDSTYMPPPPQGPPTFTPPSGY